VKVGRRHSRTANFTAAKTGVIPPPTSNLTNLITTFPAQGLSTTDMVALSGISPSSTLSYYFLPLPLYEQLIILSVFVETHSSNDFVK